MSLSQNENLIDRPTYIDLFAGCGGFSSGFSDAGFKSTVKVEIDSWACETLRTNFPDACIIEGDIKKISEETITLLKGIDVIIGGPPCQGFSVAGPSQFGISDPRNELVHHFLRWIKIVQPSFAVMENVPAILSKRNKDGLTIPDVINEELSDVGYNVNVWTLNAADYGVPQFRKRAFIVISKKSLSIMPPPATHGDGDENSLFYQANLFQNFVTSWEALSDLPIIKAGEGIDETIDYITPTENTYQHLMRIGSRGISNHVAMKHTERLIERFRKIKAGQSLKDAPLENGQVAKYTGEICEKPFKYNNYRIVPNVPCLTIPASFQSLFLHPFADRNLTAREAARLMGFPDRFIFRGKRTTMGWEKQLSQYNQIGNSVCPPLAKAIAMALSKALSISKIKNNMLIKGTSIPNIDIFRIHIESLDHDRSPPTISHSLTMGGDGDLFSMLHRGDLALISRNSVDGLTVDKNEIKWGKTTVPLGCLSLSLIILMENNCVICRKDLPPYGVHSGSIQQLISKEDLESLAAKEREHGLDYHLRSILKIDRHIAHTVSEILEAMNLCDLKIAPNPRTGKPGKSLVIKPNAQVTFNVMQAFQIWKESLKPVDIIPQATFVMDQETSQINL